MPFKSNLRTLAFSIRRRSKLALPAEIWIHILSFLADSDIVPLYGVNRVFYHVAMDFQYRLLSFCDGKGFALGNACLRDVQLKKRIKSVCISSCHPRVDEELGILPEPSQSRPATLPMRHRIMSLLRRKVPERKLKRCTPPETILEHILNVLDGAENLKELRIIHEYGPRWDFSSQILHPVSAALSPRSSLRKLYVEGYRLDRVLPLVHFHGLTSVVITISVSSELRHSMEVVPSFVKHVAPSVELLHFCVPKDYRGHSGAISIPMTEILCDDALMMPNLRELTTPLIVSPDPTLIFHTINGKYRSLTKLDLYLHVDDLLDVPLSGLALPHLRILYLTFAPDAPVLGLWDGQCGFTALDEFRIKGRYLRLEELDSMGRFFSKTTLVSLSIRVYALDGPVLRVLADYFPELRNLDLFADHLLWLGFSFSEQIMAQTLAQFAVDVQGRGLEGWGLAKLFLSLHFERLSYLWSLLKFEPPQEALSILARCIPSLRTAEWGYHGTEYRPEIWL